MSSFPFRPHRFLNIEKIGHCSIKKRWFCYGVSLKTNLTVFCIILCQKLKFMFVVCRSIINNKCYILVMETAVFLYIIILSNYII